MPSVLWEEPKNKRCSRNGTQNKAARQRRRLFQSHDVLLDDYLDIRKMNGECPHCCALHFVDEIAKTPTRSNPCFSTCCQRKALEFHPFLLCSWFTVSFCGDRI